MGKKNRRYPRKWIYIGDLYPYEVPAYTRRALKQHREKLNKEDLRAYWREVMSREWRCLVNQKGRGKLRRVYFVG